MHLQNTPTIRPARIKMRQENKRDRNYGLAVKTRK
jgi:hypothetical protein